MIIILILKLSVTPHEFIVYFQIRYNSVGVEL